MSDDEAYPATLQVQVRYSWLRVGAAHMKPVWRLPSSALLPCMCGAWPRAALVVRHVLALVITGLPKAPT